ncbi:MAG TPA: DUF4430 domain-containing protein [Mobilitalea sp.]|nr:DUF4430 domain-containing protein [Mobilitalea sp.]
MKNNKNLLKAMMALGALLLVAVIMLVAYNHFKPQTEQGSKEIVVEVVVPDQESKDFTINTDAEYLSQALEQENLIIGQNSDYGLFITEVNGRAADDTKQEWWCITKSGETVNTGADQTPIADGDHFEITLKTGY